MINLSHIRRPFPAAPEADRPVVIRRAPPAPRPPRVGLTVLLETVALEFDVSVEALRGPCRGKPLPRIRQVFCRRASALFYSTPEIGAALNRNHTSVLYLLSRLSTKQLGGENNRQGFEI